jgi:hypothetical protein
MHDPGKRYLYFMVALAVSLFFTALGRPWANVVAALLFLFSLIVAVFFISESKRRRALMIGMSFLAIFPVWNLLVPNQKVMETINNGLWVGLTCYVGLMIFRNISRVKRIGSGQVYAVISVYLLIGIAFGLVYQTILIFDPGALYFNPNNFRSADLNEGNVFYYSFITLSTVGYGDVSPAAPVVRSLSVIEAIVGIMYVATMIARFVAGHTNVANNGEE